MILYPNFATRELELAVRKEFISISPEQKRRSFPVLKNVGIENINNPIGSFLLLLPNLRMNLSCW